MSTLLPGRLLFDAVFAWRLGRTRRAHFLRTHLLLSLLRLAHLLLSHLLLTVLFLLPHLLFAHLLLSHLLLTVLFLLPHLLFAHLLLSHLLLTVLFLLPHLLFAHLLLPHLVLLFRTALLFRLLLLDHLLTLAQFLLLPKLLFLLGARAIRLLRTHILLRWRLLTPKLRLLVCRSSIRRRWIDRPVTTIGLRLLCVRLRRNPATRRRRRPWRRSARLSWLVLETGRLRSYWSAARCLLGALNRRGTGRRLHAGRRLSGHCGCGTHDRRCRRYARTQLP